MINRRKFLVALSAIPVAGVCLEKSALVDDHTTKAVKSTHVMADEIDKMRVGDAMFNGKIDRWDDHATDSYRYVLGFNDTLRAKHQREINRARERIDNLAFKRFSS